MSKGKKLWRAKSRTDEQKPHTKAVLERTSVPDNTKSDAARIPCGRCGGYMGGKLLLLPGEVLQAASRENPNTAVTTNCKKSAEAIVPEFFEGKGRTIVSP